MSDTPRTDDAVMFAVSQGMRLAPLADFARELERENTALLAKVLQLEKNCTDIYDAGRKTEERLKRENAALRAALKKHENAARENLISARIIEAENKGRNYGITRDARFILERTQAALDAAIDAKKGGAK